MASPNYFDKLPLAHPNFASQSQLSANSCSHCQGPWESRIRLWCRAHEGVRAAQCSGQGLLGPRPLTRDYKPFLYSAHQGIFTAQFTAQYERSGTRASAHPDPDPDPKLRIKSPNSVPDPSVPDHRMQYLKSDVELGVRSIPVPYPFQTKQSIKHILTLYHGGSQQASVIVPHPPDQVCDPDPPDQTT